MMNERERVNCLKAINFILKNKPEFADALLCNSNNGWIKVEEILREMKKNGYDITLEQLKCVVYNDMEKRYKFSTDFTKIKPKKE